ncbi:MAG: O-antigen ligase family protein [Bacteroidales bacterium]|nr:O-antigen ligase family protein [Bacteroidales bacterium]
MKAFEPAERLLGKIKSAIRSFGNTVGKDNKTYLCIGLCCLLFIWGGLYCLEYEYYAYAAVPVVLFVLLFISRYLPDSLLLIAFSTPLALLFRTEGFAMSIPSEPLLIVVMVLFVWHLFFSGRYDKKIVSHPVSVALIVNLVWTLITCLTSEDVFVSFKFLVSQLWFIIPCFYLGVILFRNIKKAGSFVGLYAFSLCVVVVIATLVFASHGFAFSFAHYCMQPFYNDHTAYGAAIALLLPSVTYYLIYNVKHKRGVLISIACFVAFALLVTGLILSYSRAAWISVLVAFGLWVLVKLNLSFKTYVCAFAVLAVGVALSWSAIIGKFEKNDQDSSGNMAEHITSITNISTDDSNVERLNRWACALAMFKERPLFGWGPGTYADTYGAYQKSFNRTQISTDAGDLGSTHSEYFRPLSEQGVPGFLTNTAVFVVTFIVGIRAYRRTKDKAVANLALFVLMSLTTYYVHGFLNQFLETDKLAVPFWAMTAMIVAIDIYAPRKDKAEMATCENKQPFWKHFKTIQFDNKNNRNNKVK